MITQLTGKLTLLYDDWAGIETGPFVYEVFIPEFARRQLQGKVGEEVRFYTIEYIEGNAAQGGRLTPRIVGFLSPADLIPAWWNALSDSARSDGYPQYWREPDACSSLGAV